MKHCYDSFMRRFLIITILCFTAHVQNIFALGILDEISQSTTISDLITENIKAISPSKRIFYLGNENRSFTKGDFVSIVFNAKLTARALVAKVSDNGAGLKILKIYNWQQWQLLAKGIPVQIIRGDDSYFNESQKKSKKNTEDEDLAKIESEEDLFNKTEILDENIEDQNNSLIKQDNLISLNYGSYNVIGIDNVGSMMLFNLNYDYQIGTDYWLSLTVGTGTLQQFPSVDLNTNVTSISIKGTYLFKLPFYSYLAPYVGFNYQMSDSPKAGISDGTNTQEDRDLEVAMVNALNTGEIIFGAKIIRHLAPGWYAMAGVGTDLLQVGVGIEF